MSRYVQVTTDALLGRLWACGEKLRAVGGSFSEHVVGNEVVVDFTPPHGRAFLRVYTTCARGSAYARGCGDDAIRLVAGCGDAANPFRRLWAGRKVLRTAGHAFTEEARAAAFLDRLTDAVREEYARVLKAPACRECGRAMALRCVPGVASDRLKHRFWGCSGYPTCRITREATAPTDRLLWGNR